jgi:serine/threonine-protein kinase
VSPQEIRIQLPERYRVVRHVANGGMASVWSAEDSILGRLVAVKVLASHVAAEPSARTRFEREARTAARVSDHPNVVTIYDVGEHDTVPFIVMELFTGGSVADRLKGGLGSIPRTRALAWLEQAAAALDYAHAENIVHRDIKPANLLLDERERLAVGDFGIARAAEDSSLTQAGQVLGTAAYLSPEQALGRSATAASDRYSLAVVAYELLSGRRPFQGEHVAAQARQHVEGDVPPTGLGAGVDEVLGRAMAKDPDDRYPTAARFIDELQAVGLGGRASTPTPTQVTRRVAAAPPPPPSSPPGRPVAVPAGPARGGGGRRGWLAVAAVAAVALAAGLAALLGAGGGDGGAGTQRAQRTAAEQTTPRTQSQTPQTQSQAAPPAATEQQPPATQTAPDNEPESGAGPSSAGNESPGELNDRGYALLQQGDASGAIPLLEQAVKGFEAQGDAADPTTYGYALFNLGQAYAAADRPGDAIPFFQRRLAVSPGDRPQVVGKALRDAQKAAGKPAQPRAGGASVGPRKAKRAWRRAGDKHDD